MQSRRDLLRNASIAVSMLAVPAPVSISKLIQSLRDNAFLTMDFLLRRAPQDKVDLTDVAANPASLPAAHTYFRTLLPSELPAGRFVELGCGRYSARALFPAQRYFGVDLKSRASVPTLVADVRDFPNWDTEKASLVWNNVGTWADSPRSRFAALEWAKANLVVGGLYIDEDAYNIPTDVDFAAFTLVHKSEGLTVLKKV